MIKVNKNTNNWIDLFNIPKREDGKFDWKSCNDCSVKFYYNGINDSFTILEYNNISKRFTTFYNGVKFKRLTLSSLLSCRIGKVIGVINENYQYNINDNVKNNNRDIVITDRCNIETGNTKVKSYKYKCNKCGFDCSDHYRNGELIKEYWIGEYPIIRGNGCSCCSSSPQIVVTEINSMWKTDYWMVELGVEEEFAKKYTSRSTAKAPCKCPHCGCEFEKTCSNIYNNKSIGCKKCGDGISIPEKIMYSILQQANINFEMQKTFKWSKNVNHNNDKLKGTKIYDFYFNINGIECIVETHGGQHPNTKYHNGVGFSNINNKRTSEFERLNDELKKQIALKNGIKHYIQIDCSSSSIEFIKESILKSELVDILEFKMINWNICHEFSMKNISKYICDCWNNLEEGYTIIYLSQMMNVSKDIIRDILKKGSKLGWCYYDASYEHVKSAIICNKLKRKPIYVFKNGELIHCFDYSEDLERNSEYILGEKLRKDNLYKYIDKKYYKGFWLSYSL